PPAVPTIQRQESTRRPRREYVAEARHEQTRDSHPEDNDQPCEAAVVSRRGPPVVHRQRQVLHAQEWYGLHARKTPHALLHLPKSRTNPAASRLTALRT